MRMNLMLDANCTEWEEDLAAASFLSGQEPVWTLFPPEVSGGARALLAKLKSLPESWAKELSYEVLCLREKGLL